MIAPSGAGRYRFLFQKLQSHIGFCKSQVLTVLLSLSNKFLFVANLKTASSSIERALAARAEIAISKTQFGKHDRLSVISKKFDWVRKYVAYEDFFVFGVIREPIDWLLSLYNSHQKSGFDGKGNSTKGITFSEFLNSGARLRPQMVPQHLKFVDEHKRFRVNHLIDYAQLETEFPQICEKLGLGMIPLPEINRSPQVVTRDQLSAADIGKIEVEYAEDYELLRNRPYAL